MGCDCYFVHLKEQKVFMSEIVMRNPKHFFKIRNVNLCYPKVIYDLLVEITRTLPWNHSIYMYMSWEVQMLRLTYGVFKHHWDIQVYHIINIVLNICVLLFSSFQFMSDIFWFVFGFMAIFSLLWLTLAMLLFFALQKFD